MIGIITVVLPVAMELLIPRMLQIVIDNGIRAAGYGRDSRRARW